jgi:hypothetical protein
VRKVKKKEGGEARGDEEIRKGRRGKKRKK